MKSFWEMDVRKIPWVQRFNHGNVIDMFLRIILRIVKSTALKVKRVLKGPA